MGQKQVADARGYGRARAAIFSRELLRLGDRLLYCRSPDGAPRYNSEKGGLLVAAGRGAEIGGAPQGHRGSPQRAAEREKTDARRVRRWAMLQDMHSFFQSSSTCSQSNSRKVLMAAKASQAVSAGGGGSVRSMRIVIERRGGCNERALASAEAAGPA